MSAGRCSTRCCRCSTRRADDDLRPDRPLRRRSGADARAQERRRAEACGVPVRDLFVGDFVADCHDAFLAEMAPWVASGEVRYREDIREGLEIIPTAFAEMLRGDNFGKMLVRVAPIRLSHRNAGDRVAIEPSRDCRGLLRTAPRRDQRDASQLEAITALKLNRYAVIL